MLAWTAMSARCGNGGKRRGTIDSWMRRATSSSLRSAMSRSRSCAACLRTSASCRLLSSVSGEVLEVDGLGDEVEGARDSAPCGCWPCRRRRRRSPPSAAGSWSFSLPSRVSPSITGMLMSVRTTSMSACRSRSSTPPRRCWRRRRRACIANLLAESLRDQQLEVRLVVHHEDRVRHRDPEPVRAGGTPAACGRWLAEDKIAEL